jgi:hypothetical protein
MRSMLFHFLGKNILRDRLMARGGRWNWRRGLLLGEETSQGISVESYDRASDFEAFGGITRPNSVHRTS